MSTCPLSRAMLLASWLVTVGVTGTAAAARFGVEGAAGPAFPLGGYIQSQGNEFRNGMGYNARASLIMGSMFLGYEYTSLANQSVCGASGCTAVTGDFGTTKLHSFVANYHFYFVEKPVRPYLLLGLGALFGTLGAWPTQGQNGDLYGADLRAGLGIEFPLGGNVFLSLEGRYRFLLTNNPMKDLQTTLVQTILGGGTTADVFKESLQKTHLVQGLAGIGFHF